MQTTDMDDTSRHPLDLLAEDFVLRYRKGECLGVAEYAVAHPQHASEINLLFPMIAAMEDLKEPLANRSPATDVAMPPCPSILGDYRIIREIGRGGMGIVYEAEQESLHRRVAVKVLPDHALGDPKRLQRFLVESRTAARLHHSNIVPVFGVGQDQGLHYFVMQFIDGVGLDQVIRRLSGMGSPVVHGTASTRADLATARTEPANSGILSPVIEWLLTGTLRDIVHADPTSAHDMEPRAEGTSHLEGTSEADAIRFDQCYWRSVAEIGIQVAEALQYAHAHGTVHRDIKPANLLIDKQGVVWVTDFGLAKAACRETGNQTRDVGGTLRYMSPERFRGEFDPRSDVYSLGLTLYELAVLQPAFSESDADQLVLQITQSEPASPSRWNRDIPRDLETILLKAISRDRRLRYTTAAEFADDLRRFVQDKPIRARRINPVERLARWSRRNPAIASLTMLLIAVVVSAFSVVSWKWREAAAESARAEANLSLALDSMNSTMDEFAANWMAHPVGPQAEDEQSDIAIRIVVSDESATILQDALRFYNQFAMQNAANPRLRRDTARAHRRVGQIRHRLGQLDRAEAAYRTSAAIYRELVREAPSNTDLCRKAAMVLNDLGEVIQESGRLWEADKPMIEARELLLKHPPDSPQFLECRYELSHTYSNLGKLLWRMGNRTASSDSQRRAMHLLEELSRQEPRNPNFRLAKARGYRNLYWSSFPDRDDSAKYKARAISILESLIHDFSDVPDYQCELAEMLTFVSTRPTSDDRLESTLADLQLAIDMTRQLAEKFPSIPRYQAGMARATQRLGSVLASNGRRDEAQSCLDESEQLYRHLLERFPTVEGYKSYYASVQHARGDNLRHLGRLTDSRSALESAIAHQNDLVNMRSPNDFEKGMLARQYSDLAETCELQGDLEQARIAEGTARTLRGPFRWPDRRSRSPRPFTAESGSRQSP